MKWLLMLIDFILPKRWYIVHTEVEQTVDNIKYLGEPAWFGPFKKRELNDRLNDSYADLLAYNCDELEAVKLSWFQARGLEYIASREYWLEQARDLQDDEPAIWEENR